MTPKDGASGVREVDATKEFVKFLKRLLRLPKNDFKAIFCESRIMKDDKKPREFLLNPREKGGFYAIELTEHTKGVEPHEDEIYTVEIKAVEKLEAQLIAEREATTRIINDLKERLACYRRLDEAGKK
jgi:hypothetical protein